MGNVDGLIADAFEVGEIFIAMAIKRRSFARVDAWQGA